MAINAEHFRERLEKEKAELETELSKVARVDPANPSNWEPLPPGERDISQADENIVADSIEEYEENTAITNSLEARYKDVKSGLDKIKHGVYGKCQICQKEIEEDRLEANPAARTCKEHINEL
jgi:RNA polymerase-binding transcription factor DksA